jgi:hypothetical protein
MAFSDDLIRAAVHTGQFRRRGCGAHLADVLIKRRDAIGRTYLTAVNPVVNLRLDTAGSRVENAAVTAARAPTSTARPGRVRHGRFAAD